MNWKKKLRKAVKEKRRREADESQATTTTLTEWHPEDYVDKPTQFATDVLGFKPLPYQAKLLEDKEKRIVVIWPRQCVDKNTFVYLSDGTTLPIKEVPTAWRTGRRECFKLTTEDGRELIATAEHRFLTENGWKELQELHAGDTILAPDHIPIFGTLGLTEERVKLLAYLVTDGYFKNQRQAVKFTGKEPYLSEVETCVAREFADIKPKRYPKGNCFDLMLTTYHGNSKENSLRAWLRSLDFDGGFPRIAFQLPREKLALFINRLYAADGYIAIWKAVRRSKTDTRKRNGLGAGKAAEIGLGAPDYRFVKALQLILFKFGMKSRITVEGPSPGTKYTKPFFRLRIGDIHSLRIFGEIVGPVYGKEQRSNDLQKIVVEREKKIVNGSCPKVTTFRHFTAFDSNPHIFHYTYRQTTNLRS
jgi:intein/homing endonuclease